MARIEFTSNLDRFFPDLRPMDIDAPTVAELVAEVDRRHPGLASYLVDERGALRKHVNIFVGDAMVADRSELSDAIDAATTVTVIQALSGG